MLPKWHILLGATFSAIVYYYFNLNFFLALLIFLSSFLIDIDHYFYYIFKKRDFSLKRAHEWFKKKRKKFIETNPIERKKFKRSILIFHGIESFFIIYILSLYIPLLYFIFIGGLFHIVLDLIDLIYIKEPLYTKLSIMVVFLKNKNKEHHPMFR